MTRFYSKRPAGPYSSLARFAKSVLLALLLLSAYNAAADTFAVKGTACDSVGNPESFATVRVFLLPDTVKPEATGVAAENGAFGIPLPAAGDYRINIVSFGKADFLRDFSVTPSDPVADLGPVTLLPATSLLQEVVVTAQRPLVSKEIDRIGYDVQGDAEAKTSQLDEILKKVPLVSVDPDGTIKVKGSSDFKIYKNGRPNSSFTRNAKDIFKALPASMIKKIEVITDPGAREDAEGTSAILNIITLENTIIKGVMGNIGLSYSSKSDYPNPSLWLSTQIDKVTLSLYGGVNATSKRMNKYKSESLSKYDDSGNELTAASEGTTHGYIPFFGLEGSYELDPLNLFTAEFGGYFYSFKSESFGNSKMTAPAGDILYSYSSRYLRNPNRYFDVNGSFNYQRSTRRKGETVTLSYLISTTDQKQNAETEYVDEVNLPVPYTGLSNDFKLNFVEHTAQLDWTRPVNERHIFDVGAKYIHRNNHSINNQDYFDYQKLHSDFIHRTQVLAIYFDYRASWRKFGARAGLRYEYSHLSAKYKDGSNDPFGSNLNDWVPNAAISYNIDDANTLKLSYSTRINRPGIGQLNPAVVSSPNSVSSGNPDLSSSRHQTLNLNYNLIGRKLSLDFNTSYTFSNNAVIAVKEPLPGDITKSGYANAGNNKSLNMAVWLNYNPWNKTSLMVNGSATYVDSANESLAQRTSGWGYDIYSRLRQQLPWDLALTAFFNYYEFQPTLYGLQNGSFADNVYYGLNIQRSFLKEKRLNVSIGVTNPFGKDPTAYEYIPVNAGYSGYSRSVNYNSANRFNVSLSYRFGSLNAQVKKTAKTISNDDLEGRKN